MNKLNINNTDDIEIIIELIIELIQYFLIANGKYHKNNTDYHGYLYKVAKNAQLKLENIINEKKDNIIEQLKLIHNELTHKKKHREKYITAKHKYAHVTFYTGDKKSTQ